MPQSAECPTCGGSISFAGPVEVSELVTCPECSNKAVVQTVSATGIVLGQAPKVEEDWGQ